ncbi:MAG: vWA domain-containing protein [Myxococcota bacterium]|nr:vWA domain-containing protein [Myxococcota bacterium]
MRSCCRCLPVILLVGIGVAGCVTDRPAPSDPVSGPVADAALVSSDVVLVIDRSSVSLLASGLDVDEDGVVGRTYSWVREGDSFPRPASSWTTDPDDTIHALQLRVARALVPMLALRQNRVGLLSLTLRAKQQHFTLTRLIDQPAVVVPVGPPADVLAALEKLPPARERRRSDLARSLELAAEVLDAAAPAAGVARPRAILLLSLGRPSAPGGIHWASQRALEVARELGERGISVGAVPFGAADLDFLGKLTAVAGGSLVQLDQLEARFGTPGARDPQSR